MEKLFTLISTAWKSPHGVGAAPLWESHLTNNQNQRSSLEPVDGAKDDWRQLGASYSF